LAQNADQTLALRQSSREDVSCSSEDVVSPYNPVWPGLRILKEQQTRLELSAYRTTSQSDINKTKFRRMVFSGWPSSSHRTTHNGA